jgi:hypothetical protein
MFDESIESNWSERVTPTDGRGARARERMRNAIARRKLEELDELKELETHLTEPWDEDD